MNVQCHACIGGKNVIDDIKKLESGQHVVSGTPGRVYDMICKGHLKVKGVKMLVMDEADEMMTKGFKEQIYGIYRLIPSETQVVLISATLREEILEMTETFMTDPIKILVKRDELTLDGLKQFYVAIEKEQWKFEALCDLYKSFAITQAVIFCNTRKKVEWLSEKMREMNLAISSMHGDMPQKDREIVIQEFRNGVK